MPTDNEINQVIALLIEPAQRSYFFENLKNPSWVAPLYAKGFFKHAPNILRNEKEGTVQFPIWPESKFLAKVAAQADPVILLKIIKEIETDNIRVKEDVLEIIAKLPIDSVILMSTKVVKYLEDPYLHFGNIPEKIGDIIERLASENKIEQALKIAQDLLRPIAEVQTEEAKKIGLHANPKSKFEIWDYEQILKNKLTTLNKTEPFLLLDLLVNLLFTAIKVSRGENSDDSDTEDYLYISRRNVRDEPRSHNHELEGLLISKIVSVANFAIQSDSKNFEPVLKLLESKKYNFFNKIILYLLAEYPNLDQARVTSYIKEKKFFDANWISPEYEYLLSNEFKNLTPEDQKNIIDWIEAGPDLEVFKRSEKSWTGNEPTNEKISKYKEAWQLRHLHVLKDSLTGNLMDRYIELVAKYPNFDDKIQEGVFYAANESPKTKEELQKMSVDQVISLIRDWKQTGDGYDGKPTKDGLSILLREIIKEKPVDFSDKLDELKGIDSNYIFSILMGIENGLAVNKNIHWSKVLSFLLEIFSTWKKEKKTAVDTESFDNASRRQGISLLNAGLRSGSFELKDRKEIWSIIQIALADPDPTIEQDEKFEDEITLAINSIRGEAMHSVIEYALWLKRHFEKLPDAATLISRGFDEMPEVSETLNNYLKLEVEPTKAIRSVYGRYFPWIHLLDPKWAVSNINNIFSHTEELHGDGAWDAFVTLTSPYDNLLEPLKVEYKFRLANAKFPEKDKKQPLREPNERLVEHVVAYYWRSKLSLEDDLIRELVITADIRLLSHAISFMGRVIYGEKDTPTDILKRFTEFWGYVFTSVSTDPSRVEALRDFTWWFASNKFEPKWLLDNLEAVIDASAGIDSEDFAIDNLVLLSKDTPERVIIILEKILNTASKPWVAHSSEKEIIEILKNAQYSDSVIAKDTAKRLVDALTRKHMFKFLDVLSK